MNEFFISSLSKAMNAYLNLDPESRSRINALQGKAIAIELLPFHFHFQCVFNENGVCIKRDEKIVTDATISGTPLQMIGVMLAKENRQRFFADDLTIIGDAEFAQQVTAIFDNLQIDWEEYASHLLGDVPSYHAGRVLQKFNTWFNQTKESFSENINEYVHEEAQWLPSREALQDFFTDIDSLRMDLDRIEAKFNQLKSQMENEGAL